jgi:hypothetical protein
MMLNAGLADPVDAPVRRAPDAPEMSHSSNNVV